MHSRAVILIPSCRNGRSSAVQSEAQRSRCRDTILQEPVHPQAGSAGRSTAGGGSASAGGAGNPPDAVRHGHPDGGAEDERRAGPLQHSDGHVPGAVAGRDHSSIAPPRRRAATWWCSPCPRGRTRAATCIRYGSTTRRPAAGVRSRRATSSRSARDRRLRQRGGLRRAGPGRAGGLRQLAVGIRGRRWHERASFGLQPLFIIYGQPNSFPPDGVQSVSAVGTAQGEVAFAIGLDQHLYEYTPSGVWSQVSTGSFQQVGAGLDANGQADAFATVGTASSNDVWKFDAGAWIALTGPDVIPPPGVTWYSRIVQPFPTPINYGVTAGLDGEGFAAPIGSVSLTEYSNSNTVTTILQSGDGRSCFAPGEHDADGHGGRRGLCDDEQRLAAGVRQRRPAAAADGRRGDDGDAAVIGPDATRHNHKGARDKPVPLWSRPRKAGLPKPYLDARRLPPLP